MLLYNSVYKSNSEKPVHSLFSMDTFKRPKYTTHIVDTFLSD